MISYCAVINCIHKMNLYMNLYNVPDGLGICEIQLYRRFCCQGGRICNGLPPLRKDLRRVLSQFKTPQPLHRDVIICYFRIHRLSQQPESMQSPLPTGNKLIRVLISIQFMLQQLSRQIHIFQLL